MKFELTNEQRKCIGIEPIDPDWDVVKLNDFSSIYFDSENVLRRLISYEFGYLEREYDIVTSNKQVILPRTKSGKSKKLTYSGIMNGPKPKNVGFTYFENQCAYITNFNVDKTLFDSSYVTKKLSWEELEKWIEKLSINLSEENKREILEFKHQKRRTFKYIPGDIFTYRIDLSTFGFGQILLDINKIRKEFKDNNNASLGMVFGASVLVRVFCFTSQTKKPPLELITSSIELPSIILRDNQIHIGEYEIINHAELRESDFDFPISLGLHNNMADPNHYLHVGFVTKRKPKEQTPIEFIKKEGVLKHDSIYRNNASMGRIPFTLEELINTSRFGIDWFWNNVVDRGFETDLRNPNNSQIRDRILKHFDIDPGWKYDEIRMANQVRSSLNILKNSS